MKKYNKICLLTIALLSHNIITTFFEYNWVTSNTPDSSPIWIVTPGIGNNSQVSARYCGNKGFIASTGEHIINASCIDIAMEIFVDNTEHPEIVPERKLPFSPLDLSVFALGKHIKRTHKKLLQKYKKHYYNIDNNPNISLKKSREENKIIDQFSVQYSLLNIGQQNDIDTLYTRYTACTKQALSRPQIWIGHSRGAATIFNTLSSKQCDNVALAIVEACFDSMPQVFFNYQPKWALKLRGHKFLEWILVNVTSHDINGVCPLSSVPSFPHHVPALIVTSKKDRDVPMICSVNLAQSLANTGHPNVYLLVLESSSHSGYTRESEYDKTNYQNTVHALYKKLNLPHITAYAKAGKSLLEKCHMHASTELNIV